ncbi:MAG: hydroxymethylbilane synthase [Pseudomonadota bacterium]
MARDIIKIGTRGSPLALYQAHEVRRHIMNAHDMEENQFDIKIIKTSGDKIQDKSLRSFGGKGLFTKEIEDALLAKEIDIAVHSMKDMPTRYPDGLTISCMLPRDDVRDAFISHKARSVLELPQAAVVGTSSLRRGAQIKKLRPDLKIVEFRGNVHTRLQKLQDGVADATLLAAAGLKRLNLENKITSMIVPDQMLPAIAQGAIGVEVREDDVDMADILSSINHAETQLCVNIERAFLARLNGSCKTPIAGLAILQGEENETGSGHAIMFKGQILTPDGSVSYETEGIANPEQAEDVVSDLAEALLSQAGSNFFQDK